MNGDNANMPRLTWIGHASLKIETVRGAIVYVDPYAPGDYSQPADLILVSHEHGDHNAVSLVTQKLGCTVLRAGDLIRPDGSYCACTVAGVTVEPTRACNKNHSPLQTCGFLLTFDGVCVYFASDTSQVEQMAALAARKVDYAFFPIDGQYNMGPQEAMACAAMVCARHNTAIHWFNADPAQFCPKNNLPLHPGDCIPLEAAGR